LSQWDSRTDNARRRLRATEAANACAAHLVLRRTKWWLQVIGKGQVEGDVPISDALMLDSVVTASF
jgi:integrase/recombinase XerC